MKLKWIAALAGVFFIAAMFLIPGGSSVNVQKIYEEAEKAFQEKRYQEAIDKYNAAILEGQKWGANTKVIDEDFDSLAKYKIAVCYSELGKQREDPAMYEESLKYIPPIYEKTQVSKVREGLIFLWGHNLYEMQRYEEAEPKFRELLNDYPDSQFAENAYYSLGNLYYALKQYEPAREAFLMVLNKFPNSAYLHDSQFFIARCFFDEANYDQAFVEFTKVSSQSNPALLAQARYYAGLSLLRIGRNQEALTTYQRFIADFPTSVFIPAAYFDMGTIHSKLKEYEEATRNYQLAIQNTKDELTRSEIQFQIGNNYFDQEDYQSAIAAYRTLMEVYPQSVHISEARFMIAEGLWWLKDYANAVEAYTLVLDNDEDPERLVLATHKVGECHYQLDEKEVSLEWYQKVIDNYPNSPVVKDATYGKIWALNDLKRYDEADKVARDYIAKYKTDSVYDIAAAEAQMMLGDIKFDAENYVAAADEYLLVNSDYSDLPKFDPFKSRSLLQAGFAYYKEAERSNWDMNLLAKAASAFDQLITQFEKNFNKERREFQSRKEYIIPSIINLALSYKQMREYDKAIATLNLMPKDNEEYGRAMFLRAETYGESGKMNESLTMYRNMLTDKTISESWRSRAAIELASQLRDAGRHTEAVVEYQRIIDEYPRSEFVATAMYYVGSSYFDMEPKTPENMSKAIEAFQKVLEKYPDSEVAPWAHLGIV
ncbi:tetratricopeptide repeat protein, partial [Candidatus Poribacteria bacterium]|nr:tetratricopeptide repeat protein [Candidatus Poribacteria bacterium]